MYTVGITNKSLKLADKNKVDNIIIENIFYAKNVNYFRRWARVHGGIALEWYKKTKKEAVYMMAIVARPKVGLNGRASKIEVQLDIAKRYGLIKDDKYYEYCSQFNEFLKGKNSKKLTKNKFDYRVKKLSKQFEEETGISEHIADAIVLGIAYFK